MCSDGETDVEIALREALANAVIHGNHQNPQKTSMFAAAVNQMKSPSP